MERRQRHVFQIEPEELAVGIERWVDCAERDERAAVILHDAPLRARRHRLQREGHVLEVGRVVRLVGVAGADERLDS